ncbi:MAG: SgcJ/EcaC family oxidoreductase [Anaerolineales bacterium]|nr:SgcJ/EcaC family oxidoreductase [Anaerolineales bacterium]
MNDHTITTTLAEQANQHDIMAAFDTWNEALQTGNPDLVTALYDPQAILLPTMSNDVRHNHPEIRDYFVKFLALQPQGQIDEANIQIFESVAINSGLYTFTIEDGSQIQARFTFVYVWDGDRWLIVEHHSSGMPEAV